MNWKKLRRIFASFLLAFFSFVALIGWFLVRPAPERFYYNLTANGFLPFMLTMAFTIYSVAAWPMFYAIHKGVEVLLLPQSGKGPGPPSE
jgi:hypothetical protein